jgi:hypothetical protein
MARYRINPNAVCSSKNYKQSKRLHMDMLKRKHEVFMEMVLKEEIVVKRQAYVKVLGNLVAITPSEVTRFEKEMTIIWK